MTVLRPPDSAMMVPNGRHNDSGARHHGSRPGGDDDDGGDDDGGCGEGVDDDGGSDDDSWIGLDLFQVTLQLLRLYKLNWANV